MAGAIASGRPYYCSIQGVLFPDHLKIIVLGPRQLLEFLWVEAVNRLAALFGHFDELRVGQRGFHRSNQAFRGHRLAGRPGATSPRTAPHSTL